MTTSNLYPTDMNKCKKKTHTWYHLITNTGQIK